MTRVVVAQYRGISTISSAVRFQTRSVWSHSALYNLDTGEVAEALANKNAWTISKSLSENHTPGTVVDLFTVPGLDEDGAWVEALSYEGIPYDYRAIWRFISRRPFADNGRLFCSEGVSMICDHNGVRLQNKPHWEMAPEHVGISPLLKPYQTVLTYVV